MIVKSMKYVYFTNQDMDYERCIREIIKRWLREFLTIASVDSFSLKDAEHY